MQVLEAQEKARASEAKQQEEVGWPLIAMMAFILTHINFTPIAHIPVFVFGVVLCFSRSLAFLVAY